MKLGIAGRVALVVGGSRGIGAASARQLAAEGAKLAIVARGGSALQSICRDLTDAGSRVLGIEADMLDPTAAQRIVAEVLEHFGALDILVACVGDAQGGLFWEIEDSTWQEALNLKFMANVRLLRATLPRMSAAGYGRVVVVVGNNGKQPSARMLPGAAANAACLAVIKGVADEVAGTGVVVNAINPGPTRTDRWTRLMSNMARTGKSDPATLESEFVRGIPVGRIAEADEIGRLVTLLASEHVAMVTGTSLLVDGGATRAMA
jgi:NAD(P)-dependent dehydrogenase (short-subunit alcohol dehydrogenase family)